MQCRFCAMLFSTLVPQNTTYLYANRVFSALFRIHLYFCPFVFFLFSVRASEVVAIAGSQPGSRWTAADTFTSLAARSTSEPGSSRVRPESVPAAAATCPIATSGESILWILITLLCPFLVGGQIHCGNRNVTYL